MLLEVKNLNAGYGFLQVLWNINVTVDQGEYVCLVGPNGAGKSTLLRTLAGLLDPMGGDVIFDGRSMTGVSGHLVARGGISYISEEMNLFCGMTVHENLAMGAYAVKEKAQVQRQLDFVFDLFPRLREREKQIAGTMSGGERKMLGIARGLMSSPRLLMVDEPSFGLAPILTAQVFDALDTLNKKGLTILLVEQNVTKTLCVTQRAYILEKGKVVLEGPSPEVAQNEHVRKVFLGH